MCTIKKKICIIITAILLISNNNYNTLNEEIYDSISEYESISSSNQNRKIIDVPYINQDKIVYGCEAVSSTMLLQYCGYKLSAKEFTDNYLIKKDWYIGKNKKIYGPDPNAAFPGNPYKSSGINCGFGCYAPSTAKSINKILDQEKHEVKVTTGTSIHDLIEKYIDNDIPLLIWATMGMSPSRKTMSWIINYVDENSKLKIGDTYTWTAGEHCLVLVGYDKDKYYFNDPYKNHGLIGYQKSLVEKRFDELGKQSLVILQKENSNENKND